MTLSLLLALAVLPMPLMSALLDRPVWAQTPEPTFPLPASVPDGTTVRINGSSSMEQINQALEERFTSQFSGTTVETAYDGSDEALQAVRNGTIDLAAIGRPLTAEEQAQGLVAVPVARNKIAVIVGADNPFNASLTSDQFAEMFRGQITSWSQVGGSGPLRFIDRPEDSDTRRAFQAYPVFQTAPFQAGLNAVSLSEDSTEAVIEELGTDGIGYAIAEQVAGNPNVRAVLLHDTPPTDPRYPFSQPLSYVYLGPNPSPAVQAFLGYATAPENQLVVEEARRAGALVGAGTIAQVSPSPEASPEASPEVTASPSPTVTATAEASPGATPSPGATATTSPETFPATDPSPTTTAADREAAPWWLWLLAIPLLGALLWWLLRDRGAPVATTGAVAGVPVAPLARESRIILTPRNCRDGYVYWEVPESVLSDRRQQRDDRLMVRLYDVTDIDLDHQSAHSMQQFDCDARSQDLHVPIPVDNRDYIAELGYQTADDRWIQIARSTHVRVPACGPADDIDTTGVGTTEVGTGVSPVDGRDSVPVGGLGTAGLGGVAAGAAAMGAGAIGAGAIGRSVASARPENESRVILTPRNTTDAYVYWEVSQAHQTALQQQGGRDLRLRLYDTTGIDLDQHSAHSVREYKCDASAQDLHVPLPAADQARDYVAELGYITEDGRWLSLARSTPTHIPATQEADRSGVVSQSARTADRPIVDRPIVDRPIVDRSVTSSGDTIDNSPGRISPPTDDSSKPASGSIGNVVKTIGAAVAGSGAAAGVGRVVQSLRDDGQTDTIGGRLAGNRVTSDSEQHCRIILVPRNPRSAYAYWEVSENYRKELRQQGGQILMLRIHDATNLDIDYQPAHNTQDYVCDESEWDKHVTIPESDRDYVAELGYVTEDGRWLRLIRSLHVRVPPDNPSL